MDSQLLVLLAPATVLGVRSGMPTSLAVLLGFAWHQRVTWPELDAPSRSMLVTPVFLYLARVDVPIFRCYR